MTAHNNSSAGSESALQSLLAYQQADEDGVMVLASRQAIHEVAEQVGNMRHALEMVWDANQSDPHIPAIALASIRAALDGVSRNQCSCARAGFPGSCDNCDADSGPIKYWRERALEAEALIPTPAQAAPENDHNCECSVCAERYAQLRSSADTSDQEG